jgi:Ca-activated chloride channel family protein
MPWVEEEMVNFFKYKNPQPQDQNPFSITTEYSDCPGIKTPIVKIVCKAKYSNG